jgi:glycosyltransferase involved in cell wall biosynthesis
MKTPKVSVLIATYDYSSVLRYAVASVLRQSFADFELIVAGDGCTDDSEAVVASFADPRVRWLNLTENSGSKSLPLNAASKIARGKYIAYLGHDDLWHRDHLRTVVDAIESTGADFVYTVALYVPPPGETDRPVSGIYPTEFERGHVLVHSSVLHPKAVLERTGEWPDYRQTKIPGDHMFWINAAAAGLRFVSVPKVTVWKFNASSRPGCYIDQRCAEQARYFDLLESDPGLAEKDLIAALRSAMVHGLEPLKTYRVGRDAPPGGHIQRLLQIRGLTPAEPMEVLPPDIDENSFRIEIAEPLPGNVKVNEVFEFEVRIENKTAFQLASNDPHPVNIGYHWLLPDGTVAVLNGARSTLIPPLPPQASLHYIVAVKAPSVPGSYRLLLALVQEHIRWFDRNPSPELPVIEVREVSLAS